MPKSKSKRKARSGRGRTHRVYGTPYSIMRHFPMWDEDQKALKLDVEVAFRVLRDGTASKDDLETAACTLAARFESSALIAERVLDKGRLHAAALREGISKLYYLLQDLQKGVTPTESVWQSIEYGVDAVQAVEEAATRDELHGAYLAVMERRMRVEAQAIKEAQE